MTIQELKEEIGELGSGEQVTLVLSDGDTCEFGASDCWVGGESFDGYMCDILGNISYATMSSCLTAVLSYVEKELGLSVEEVEI
jgi:hypothetical protein